jgi:probable HAF family extracellular repeat protein
MNPSDAPIFPKRCSSVLEFFQKPKTQTARFNIWALLLICSTCLFSRVSEAQPPTYVIIDLGDLGGGASYAFAMNNNGQVVGAAKTSSGYYHAFFWNGSMQETSARSPITFLTVRVSLMGLTTPVKLLAMEG